MKTILCVVAHPDDECFMGGTLARLSAEDDQVYVLALADGEMSRVGATDGDVVRRMAQHDAAVLLLGCHVVTSATVWRRERFADQRLDAVPLLDLTRVIELAIQDIKPETVYTHSPHDLNVDHRRVHDAVLPAVRPKSGVWAVYAFAGPRMLQFTPTSFVVVTEEHLEQQRAALASYGDELSGGEWELIKARAVEGGYRVGTKYAEGFEVIREAR